MESIQYFLDLHDHCKSYKTPYSKSKYYGIARDIRTNKYSGMNVIVDSIPILIRVIGAAVSQESEHEELDFCLSLLDNRDHDTKPTLVGTLKFPSVICDLISQYFPKTCNELKTEYSQFIFQSFTNAMKIQTRHNPNFSLLEQGKICRKLLENGFVTTDVVNIIGRLEPFRDHCITYGYFDLVQLLASHGEKFFKEDAKSIMDTSLSLRPSENPRYLKQWLLAQPEKPVEKLPYYDYSELPAVTPYVYVPSEKFIAARDALIKQYQVKEQKKCVIM